MNIELDQTEIQTALNAGVNKAVESAMTDYNLQSQLREKIVNKVLASAIGDTIATSIDQIDLSPIATGVSKEVTRLVAVMATAAIREAAVNIVMMLRYPSYLSEAEKTAKRAIITAELNQQTR